MKLAAQCSASLANSAVVHRRHPPRRPRRATSTRPCRARPTSACGSCGLTTTASANSSTAPANSLSTSTPLRPAAGRDELLGDEVHPVAQRRHDHHVGGQVQGDELFERQAAVQVVDGRVPEHGELAVHRADELLDVLALGEVVADLLAARDGELHQHEVGALRRGRGRPSAHAAARGTRRAARRCPWCSRVGRRRASTVGGSPRRSRIRSGAGDGRRVGGDARRSPRRRSTRGRRRRAPAGRRRRSGRRRRARRPAGDEPARRSCRRRRGAGTRRGRRRAARRAPRRATGSA